MTTAAQAATGNTALPKALRSFTTTNPTAYATAGQAVYFVAKANPATRPMAACLRLAYKAAEKGGAHAIALNAADEVAVEAFLDHRIPFTGIPRTIERVLASTQEAHPATIAEVLAADREARQIARAFVPSQVVPAAAPMHG